MSYDLTVFDPLIAPDSRQHFITWFKEQFDWDDDYLFEDPNITTLELRNWLYNMIEYFPAMNGPFASKLTENNENLRADYNISEAAIYVTFGWSQMESAYKTSLKLAERHKVGFYDVSSSRGEIWRPNSEGVLVIVSSSV